MNFDVNSNVVNFQGPLAPGLSGAPIFNKQGQLIAIGNGGLMNGQIDISWGIPSYKISMLEKSVEDIVTSNQAAKSSEILFSSEITFNISSIDKDFFKIEKEALQKNSVKVAELIFYKTATKSLTEIRLFSNDQQGLVRTLSTFPRAVTKDINFDIYKNFETGAVFVIPEGLKSITEDNSLIFTSDDGKFKYRIDRYKLLKSFDMSEELCKNSRIVMPVDSGYIWTKDTQNSYMNPITTTDGQYINREAYSNSSFVTNSNATLPRKYAFLTTAKKNTDLFFSYAVDQHQDLDYIQTLGACIQDAKSSDSCDNTLKEYKVWVSLIVSTILFSFSL